MGKTLGTTLFATEALKGSCQVNFAGVGFFATRFHIAGKPFNILGPKYQFAN